MVLQNRFINLLIVGISGGGKSSLRSIFLQEHSDHSPTNSIEITHMREIPGHSNLGVAIWEIPGSLLTDAMVTEYYKNKEGAFLIQPVNEEINYLQLEQLIKEISVSTNQAPFAIILNKTDMPYRESRTKVFKKLYALLQNYLPLEKCKIFETSANTHKGVNEAFNWMLSVVVDSDGMEDSQTTPLNSEECFTALIHLSDIGPDPLIWDFSRLPDKLVDDNVEQYLGNLALSLIASLAQGANYNEGVFLLPAGYSQKYKLLAIASKITDSEFSDSRNEIGYGVLCLLFPADKIVAIPQLAKIQDGLLAIFREVKDISQLTKSQLRELKKQMIAHINSVECLK